MATFPFIPSGTNNLYGCYNNLPNDKSDLWSVRMFLLFFLSKKQLFIFKEIQENTQHRRNALYQYIALYGYGKIKIKNGENMLDPDLHHICRCDKKFIEKNIVTKDKDAIDLVKGLLELNLKKRLTVDKL